MNYDLIINGAGPVGCISALLAAKLDIKVLLIDKFSKDKYRGNAHYFNAYSIEILEQCGLDILELLEKSTNKEYAFSMAYGSSLVNLYLKSNLLDNNLIRERYHVIGKYGAAINVPLKYVYGLLMNELDESQNIDVLWDSEIIHLDVKNNLCKIKTSSKQELFVEYKDLLACDGSNSKIRSLVNIDVKKNILLDFINIEIESNLSEILEKKALLNWIFHPFNSACFVLHEINGIQNIQIPIFPHQKKKLFNDDHFIESYIKGILGNNVLSFKVISKTFWSVNTYCIDKFSENNIHFLGDSAHVCTPAGGLGLNSGIHDAANIIWKIKQSYHHSNILFSYAKERKVINKKIVQKSEENFEDFKSIVIYFGLPSNSSKLLTYPYSFVQKFNLQKRITKLYETSITKLWKNSSMKINFNKRLAKTLEHFDGMDYHIGYNYYNQTISLDNIALNCKHSMKDTYTPGSIWFNHHLFSNDDINMQFMHIYGRWQVYLFNSRLFNNFPFSKNIDIFKIGVDFKAMGGVCITDAILIIRPDRIIDYFGTMEDLKESRDSIFNLTFY